MTVSLEKGFLLVSRYEIHPKVYPAMKHAKDSKNKKPPEKTGLIENITLTHCLQTSIWRSHLLWTEHAYNLLFQSDVVIPGFQASAASRKRASDTFRHRVWHTWRKGSHQIHFVCKPSALFRVGNGLSFENILPQMFHKKPHPFQATEVRSGVI